LREFEFNIKGNHYFFSLARCRNNVHIEILIVRSSFEVIILMMLSNCRQIWCSVDYFYDFRWRLTITLRHSFREPVIIDRPRGFRLMIYFSNFIIHNNNIIPQEISVPKIESDNIYNSIGTTYYTMDIHDIY